MEAEEVVEEDGAGRSSNHRVSLRKNLGWHWKESKR
jgi:hypothetical protein